MPSSLPRVQVTVDPELAAAMDEIDPRPASRSRLIRDLAIRGAEVERDERQRRRAGTSYLLSIARGDTDYDFETARAIHEQREADLA
jgi:metal-responsive CopG/Arc/MetJ family transcriptional regulator